MNIRCISGYISRTTDNHADKAIDEAVTKAYGWGDDWRAGLLTDDEILSRLFKLNQEREAKEKS